MARTIRNTPSRPEQRQRRLEAAVTRRRLAARDAHRTARLEAAPAPLWVVSGDWEQGFDVYPLRHGCRPSAAETLLADPGDAAHLSGAVTFWDV